jgi:hemolysin activation/secretion protein
MRFWLHILILAALANLATGQTAETNSSPATARSKGLNISGYHIEGNTVLPPGNFGMLSQYTGTNLDFSRLREGLVNLQMRYHDLGFPTISVTLPPQKLTNGIVKVKVIEGRLSKITIAGNQHFSDANIRRALPSLTTNILINTKWFQPELDAANASRDRQIYPVISPGPDPGTTELTLKVKDRLPLHGRIEVNDKSSPGTPLLRGDIAMQYANLWQLEHQIGFDYNASPQSYKGGENTFSYLDRPMVASYSAFYRLPLGFGRSYREKLEQEPVTFGYDEISHKFSLPPPSGHPDLTLYASRSTSDTPLQSGAVTSIFTNTLADISSQYVQHTFTENNNAGAKLTLPLPEIFGVKSSLQLGVDFKAYNSKLYSTNLTYFDLYALDQFGHPVLVTNETLHLPAQYNQSLYYLPLSIGWSASRVDQHGYFAFNWNENIFLAPLASRKSDFQSVAGVTGAGGTYTTLTAGLTRQQNFDEWTASLHADGQWASAPLISNEQFSLGGTAGVRGYQEGEAYGDNGWRAMFDLRTPAVIIGNFPTADGTVPAELRVDVFMDYGQVFLLDRAGNNQLDEWGTGVGFFLTAGEHFDARLTLAWALTDAYVGGANHQNNAPVSTQAGNATAYFTIGFQY